MQFLNILNMGIDVYGLAMECSDMVIQVKASDLMEAAHVFAKDIALISESKSKETRNPNTLLTKKEVMKLLGVGETTLWRWATKYDYLHPVMVGGKRCWKWKDIEAIMEGNVTDYYGKPVWGPEQKQSVQ